MRISRLGPGHLLAVATLELTILVALLLGWQYEWPYVKDLPQPIGGVLPLLVPWAGALGGVAISYVGLAEHWRKWERRPTEGAEWNAWYLVRAPLGAVLGSIGSLAVVFVLGTLGTDVDGDIDVSPQGTVVLLLISFVLGYRQEAFADLIGRVSDIILVPGGSSTVGYSLSHAELTFETAPQVPTAAEVEIANTGSGLLRVPRSALTITGPDKDAFSITRVSGNIAAKGFGTVEVTYTPQGTGQHRAELLVELADNSQTVHLVGTCA